MPGYIAFLWPALMILLVGREMPFLAQLSGLAILGLVSAWWILTPEKISIREGDKQYMAPPRLTFLGKLASVLLAPADFLRLGWQFRRPITLDVLRAQATAVTGLSPDFHNDADEDSSWYEEKFGVALGLLNGGVRLTSLGRHIATQVCFTLHQLPRPHIPTPRCPTRPTC